MKKFQRIIVALDNSDFDETLIQYVSRFTELTLAEKIYFVYVERNLELPKDLKVKYKDVHGNEIPRDELLRKVLKQKVEENFTHSSEVEVEVLEGSPLKELLHWIKVKNADLMVLGNKKISEGSGVLARKVARNADCDLLFVPEAGKDKGFEKVLVPTDFSTYSKIAMTNALELAKERDGDKNVEITAFHVFDVPMQGYPTINFNYETFTKSVLAFKMEAFKKYMDQFEAGDIKVADAYQENDPPGIAKHINKYAQKHNMDLIVMGAQGHSFFERVLIGSVAEKLVTIDKAIPTFILRK